MPLRSQAQVIGESLAVVKNGNISDSPQIDKHDAMRVVAVPAGQRQSMPGVSVVIPCLNEQATIVQVVHEAKAAFDTWAGNFEVIVADNGSDDRSPSLAAAAGARVISVPMRGY